MKFLSWAIVFLVLSSLILISTYEDELRDFLYKEERIRAAPPQNCVFGNIGITPAGYFSTGLYFSGSSNYNYNGHLSLISNSASLEIFCPVALSADYGLTSGVEFLRVRCGVENKNCHVYESTVGASRLSFGSGVTQCSFRNNCIDDEICILRINQAENAHIAECSYSGYSNAVCCGVASTLCNDNSDCGSGQICQGGSCVVSNLCGNSIIDLGEQCDCGVDGNCNFTELGNKTCFGFANFTNGTLGCYPQNSSDQCEFNYADCIGEDSDVTCGDSVIDYNNGEYCDINNPSFQYCNLDPKYIANPSLMNQTVSCINENNICTCKWSPQEPRYLFGECYCPVGQSCNDGNGTMDKYLLTEVNGQTEKTLVEQLECELEVQENTKRFSTSDYIFMTFIILLLSGLFFGINYYLRKRKV